MHVVEGGGFKIVTVTGWYLERRRAFVDPEFVQRLFLKIRASRLFTVTLKTGKLHREEVAKKCQIGDACCGGGGNDQKICKCHRGRMFSAPKRKKEKENMYAKLKRAR